MHPIGSHTRLSNSHRPLSEAVFSVPYSTLPTHTKPEAAAHRATLHTQVGVCSELNPRLVQPHRRRRRMILYILEVPLQLRYFYMPIRKPLLETSFDILLPCAIELRTVTR